MDSSERASMSSSAPSAAGGSTASDVNTNDQEPDTTYTAEGDGDGIISFNIKFKNAAGNGVQHNLATVKIFCHDQYAGGASDIHQILGAKRIRGFPTYDPMGVILHPLGEESYKVNNGDGLNIKFTGFFPAQRLSEPFVYLRTSLGN